MRINPSLNNFGKLSEEFDMIMQLVLNLLHSETPLSAYVKLSEKNQLFSLNQLLVENKSADFHFLALPQARNFHVLKILLELLREIIIVKLVSNGPPKIDCERKLPT